MTTDQLIAYYVNLLVIQYKTLPDATSTINAVATEVVADQIYSQVLNGFELGTAVGKQLDILASYVGAPRKIFGYDPTIPYFALTPYADTPATNVGFGTYAGGTPVDNWLSYYTTETTFTLTDGQLTQLIQYMIAVHGSNHTISSIDLILQQFFGNYCTFTDNMNMTMTYTHHLTDPGTLFGIVNELNILPHPAGVGITVVEV